MRCRAHTRSAAHNPRASLRDSLCPNCRPPASLQSPALGVLDHLRKRSISQYNMHPSGDEEETGVEVRTRPARFVRPGSAAHGQPRI